MMKESNTIQYIQADQSHVEWALANWSKVVAMHMHIEDGFTILAMDGETPVGVIAVYWKKWIAPMEEQVDGYIDIIEVHPEYRRKGIARTLVQMAEEQCRAKALYQIRAWSSDDKLEALPMWKELGYAMCPTQILVGPKEDIKVKGYYVAKVLG